MKYRVWVVIVFIDSSTDPHVATFPGPIGEDKSMEFYSHMLNWYHCERSYLDFPLP